MVGRPFPSGNLLVDRRAEFAATMAHAGDFDAAIEVLSGALDIAPEWAAGWFWLGEYHEQTEALEKAANAWRQAMALDPSDPFGAGLKLDLLREVPVAETMPSAFVETLFDQYAPRFEISLLEQLDYRGPELLMNTLKSSGFTRAHRALDLGCGTGLMGAQLRSSCDWLGGYDISRGMLDEAEAKGIYDLLDKQDLSDLALSETSYDLIVAADVFIYLGALEQIVGWCAQALEPCGFLAFTLEHGDKPIELRESRRFAHSPAYVTELLQTAGFQTIMIEDCVLRQDRGEDIRSFCVIATPTRQTPELDWDRDEAVPA